MHGSRYCTGELNIFLHVCWSKNPIISFLLYFNNTQTTVTVNFSLRYIRFFTAVPSSFVGPTSGVLQLVLYISQFPLRPAPGPPPPRLLWSICKFCAARVLGICSPQGFSQAFDTYAFSYQNITTQRILLEKRAYWLICQGQEKIEEGCKGMFLILCMHFFIAYQAWII